MKDPAFLFYPADFLGGVSDLTMEERGQYITLLCIQHQKGSINTKRVGLILGYEWVSLSNELRAKFVVDENGDARNARLAAETEKRAQLAERQRINGSKGGRPKNPNKTQIKPNYKPKQNPTINPNKSPRVENVNENINKIENTEKGGTGEKDERPDVFRDTFETFRRNYDGRKRGLDTELAVLQKHKDWRDVVMRLCPILDEQKRWRDEARRRGVFVPSWPNLQTWFNQRRWEDELNFNFENQTDYGAQNRNRGNAIGGGGLTVNERKYGSTAATKAAIIAEARELDRRRASQ